jgi:glycosyltransferase involved in cell wall biosynthesis
LITAPKDAAALTSAITRLLDDGALATRLGDAARRVASADFSREAMLDKMEQLFFAVTQKAT